MNPHGFQHPTPNPSPSSKTANNLQPEWTVDVDTSEKSDDASETPRSRTDIRPTAHLGPTAHCCFRVVAMAATVTLAFVCIIICLFLLTLFMYAYAHVVRVTE